MDEKTAPKVNIYIYILTTLLIISIILLLSSCGQNNPLSPSQPNSAMTGPNGMTGCSKVPGTIDPKMYWPASGTIPAASMPDLLRDLHANPNASGPMKPFDQLCGLYKVAYAYQYHRPLYYIDSMGIFHMWCDLWKTVSLNGNIINSSIVGEYKGDNLTIDLLPASYAYTIPCDLFPPGTMLPSDFFMGDGYPDGDYVFGGEWFNKSGGTVTPKGKVNPACDPDGARPKKLVNLDIQPPTQTVKVGQTASFSAVVHYSDGSTKDVTVDAKWTASFTPDAPASSPPAALVSPTGLNGMAGNPIMDFIENLANGIKTFLANKPGKTNISTTYQGMSATGTSIHTNQPTLDRINITPPNATIYIHHPNQEMRQKQFTAGGIFKNPYDLKDITQSVEWSTSDTTIATISNFGIHKGLAFAGSKPGTVDITAASTTNAGVVTSDPPAKLCVDCWKYTHIRQNVGAASSALYAMNADGTPRGTNGYDQDGGANWTGIYLGKEFSIANKGCHLVSAAMVLTAATGNFVNPADLNATLQTTAGGYIPYPVNAPNWDVIKLLYPDYITSVSMQNSPATIDQILQTCDMAIIETGPCYLHPSNHFVLAVKKVNGTYKIYDPWIIRNSQGEITENIEQLDDLNDTARGLKFTYYTAITIKK